MTSLLYRRLSSRFQKSLSGVLLGVGLIIASGIARGETLVIPAITVAQRYDSNVYNTGAIQGVHLGDFVSSAMPQLNLAHKGSLAEGSAQLMGIGEKFIYNPGLDYVGGGAGFNLNLTRLIGALTPRATLNVSSVTLFKPQAPSFGTTGVGNAIGEQAVNPFARGIEISRVETLVSTSAMRFSYNLTQAASFQANYSLSIIRFGHSFTPNVVQSNLINTNTHLIMAGPQIRVTSLDTIGINYLYQRTDFSGRQTTGIADRFESHGGTLNWGRSWSTEFKSYVYGGATALLQQGVAAPVSESGTGVAPSSLVLFNGGANLVWTDTAVSGGSSANIPQGSMMGSAIGSSGVPGSGANTVASLSYTVGVFPSFSGAGLPLLSQVVSTFLSHRLSSSFFTNAGAQYSRNDSVGDTSNTGGISFQSYGGNAGLSYVITPTLFASLRGEYQHFSGNGAGVSGVIGGLGADFDRYVTMVSLTTFWN